MSSKQCMVLCICKMSYLSFRYIPVINGFNWLLTKTQTYRLFDSNLLLKQSKPNWYLYNALYHLYGINTSEMLSNLVIIYIMWILMSNVKLKPTSFLSDSPAWTTGTTEAFCDIFLQACHAKRHAHGAPINIVVCKPEFSLLKLL